MQAVKKNISIIPATRGYDRTIRPQMKAMRVAAYCRVSTLQEQQETSYDAQVNYYREKIENNPSWKLAGIYADDGKSATSTKNRSNFQAMIEDCMAGKIDMVITKSISRFARNTVDSLMNIRKLKEKNIAVFFEKEGINTLDGSGELLVTILSSQAQEESRNISENCHWGIVRKFESGKVIVNHSKFLGYTKDKDGNLVIIPEEADLVRRIFRLFLEGNSSYKIKRILEADGILTVTGKTVWQATVIDKMLSNEKYMGDALMQKTYTVDFLTKKKVINKSIVPQYYIEDNHEAIIPKELYQRVQEEKARRGAIYRPASKKVDAPSIKGKYSAKYVLSDIMVCAECGQPYRRQVWSKYGMKKAVWRCDNRLKHGSKRCKHSPTLKEDSLHEAIMTAINNVVEDQGEFVQAFRENVIRIIGSYSAQAEPTEYDEQIEQLQQEMMKLIEDSAKAECADDTFDKEYRIIADEIKELRKKKTKVLQERHLAESYEQRLQEMSSYTKKINYLKREFDDDLVRRLLQTIRVISESKIEIQFKSGIVIRQDVLCDD
ncbi:recombinase family protein [Sinanaerobacter sp. ZZT-01]|uniref:recombinase family protein n=1 Tax=Sinanaerobacter sp. ZZT-01 TaxID=3111540 RepID=UPI002D793D31|nr:recombinase family protein [Sinanaerobacter sp. ZZT-01]WRR93982.1 recombinase family protein [Sinanaerobacter sp. ZZT-01]